MKHSKLNPEKLDKVRLHANKESNPNGLNSYNSLNRAVRIKELATIVDSNRRVLGRLQKAESHYSTDRQTTDFMSKQKLSRRLS